MACGKKHKKGYNKGGKARMVKDYNPRMAGSVPVYGKPTKSEREANKRTGQTTAADYDRMLAKKNQTAAKPAGTRAKPELPKSMPPVKLSNNSNKSLQQTPAPGGKVSVIKTPIKDTSAAAAASIAPAAGEKTSIIKRKKNLLRDNVVPGVKKPHNKYKNITAKVTNEPSVVKDADVDTQKARAKTRRIRQRRQRWSKLLGLGDK